MQSIGSTRLVSLLLLVASSDISVINGQFTWMTPYNTSTSTDWADVLKNVPSTCSLKQVQVVSRHGSRSPSQDQINAALAVAAKVKHFLTNNNSSSSESAAIRSQLEIIANWKPSTQFFTANEQTLLPRGVTENQFLAANYRNLFAKYNLTGTVIFKSTSQQRAIASSSAFEQYFSNLTTASNKQQSVMASTNNNNNSSATSSATAIMKPTPLFVLQPNVIDDDRLSFFTKCDSYVARIKNNASTRPEFTQIEKLSLQAERLVKSFNERLFPVSVFATSISSNDIPTTIFNNSNSTTNATTKNTPTTLKNKNVSLSFDEIAALYYMVGFEIMANGSSELAKIFSPSDLEFFDYADDLETYWKGGPGYPLNIQASCGLTKFLLNAASAVLSAIAHNASYPVGIFQFGHSETLIPLYGAFGLFKDSQPLLANASRDFIRQRAFKASEMVPFAANLAMLLFSCENKNLTEERLVVIVNGKIQRLPIACPNSDMCPLATVLTAYNATVGCDEAKICRSTDSDKGASVSSAPNSHHHQVHQFSHLLLILSAMIFSLIQ